MANAIFNKISKIGLGFAFGAAVVDQVTYDVDAGEAAVLFDSLQDGIQEEVYGEGMHFRIPIIQEPIMYNIRMQPRVFDNSTQSKDLQTVSISTRILYRPMKSQLPRIYRQLGVDYDNRVLKSIAEEVIKSVVADYDAEQLITMREVVAERVTSAMRERAATFNIEFQDVSLIDIQFGRDFRESVEIKQVAAQEAEMQKYLVEEAEYIKEAKIIVAEGEAESADMLNQTISVVGSGIIEKRKIEAAVEIAKIMSRSRNVAYLPGGGSNGQPMLLNMNVGGQ
eukprot:gene4190-23238_t